MRHMKKWLLLLLLLLILTGCKLVSEQKGIMIKDVVISKLDSNNMSISFNIKNLNNSAADCYANISSSEKEVHKDIGMIKARHKEKKQINLALKNVTVQIKIEPICKWVDDLTFQKCNTGNYIDRRICEFVLKKPELQQCLANDKTYYKLFCIALLTKNYKICNYINTNVEKNWCKAYVTKNVKFCNQIKNKKDKDWCYTDLGMNFKDSAICNKINDAKYKTSCTAAATQSPELCLGGAKEFKLSCIVIIAESTGNKNICELLGEQKKECYSSLEG